MPGTWVSRSFPLADSEFSAFLEIRASRMSASAYPGTELGASSSRSARLTAGSTENFEGTGLGLAMVKLLAELHGGTAAVASAVGEGSDVRGVAAAPDAR